MAGGLVIAVMSFLTFSSLIIQSMCLIVVDAGEKTNNRPIIGVLSQELSYKLQIQYSEKYDSYIAASYIKFIECSGARVVPIWIGQNETYYDSILSKINGVLLPGGTCYFNTSNGFAEAGAIIYRLATEMNKRGDYFPIWGTCLGFELMIYLAADEKEVRSSCDGMNVALPLDFKPGFMNSRLFKHAPHDITEILRNKNVTANFHQFCITEDSFRKAHLNNSYRVLSVNQDKNNLKFISTIEHVSLPFYGTQYHPEKNNFEWKKKSTGMPHSSEAIRVSQYFSNFFVDEARKNHHVFPSEQEEQNTLIYKYHATYTLPEQSSFEQCYLFSRDMRLI